MEYHGTPSVAGSHDRHSLNAYNRAFESHAGSGFGYMGEPRAFRLAPGEPRAGLQSGDVISLRQQGVPFVASQARLPFKEDALQWVLQPQDADADPAPEGCSYLEVVRQGGFIGLRSAAAGGRFLQPRRKAPHRLVFFNTNCGVWEQWEVEPACAEGGGALGPAGADPAQPPPAAGPAAAAGGWSRVGAPMPALRWSGPPSQHATASHMPTTRDAHRTVHGGTGVPGGGVEVAVEVRRVGRFPPSSHAASTPRSLSIAPELPREDSHMTRISSLMLSEWLRFVGAEKQVHVVRSLPAGVHAATSAFQVSSSCLQQGSSFVARLVGVPVPEPRVPNHAFLNHAFLNHAFLNHAFPNHAFLNHAFLNHAFPNHAFPNHAFPNHAFLNHAFPNHAFPNHAFPNHAFPNHAFLNHAFPNHAFPNHAFLNHAFPNHAFPNHAFLGHAFPNHAFPNHAFPNHAFPNHAFPNHAFLNHAFPNHAFPNHAFPNHAFPNHAFPNHAFPNHAFPNHAFPNHAFPNHAVPNHAFPNHAFPNHAVPNHAFPNHAFPNHAFPNHAFPNHAFPNHAFPNHAFPNHAFLGHAFPNHAFLNHAFPNHAFPNHAFPNHAFPNHAFPNHAFPNHAFPNHAFPNHAFPNHAFPNHAFPNHAFPNHAFPNHAFPNHAFLGHANHLATLVSQARGMVEREVDSLSLEMEELKSATFGQVEYLRGEMNAEMMSLFTQLQQRQAVIVQQRQHLHRAQACSVSRMLCRRRHADLKALFHAWWAVACDRLDWRGTVSALRMGRQRSQLLHALRGWAELVSRKRLLGLLLVQAVKAFSLQRLHAVFRVWMELSARMVARHWLVADMVLHLSSRQLAAAFDSWQGLWRCRAAGRSILTRMAARQDGVRLSAAFQLWSRAVDGRRWTLAEVGCLVVSRATRAARGVLLEWCDVTRRATARRQILLRLLLGHTSRRSRAVFGAWRAQVFHATVLRGRLCRLIDRQAVRRLYACVAAWADLTSQSLRQAEATAAASRAVRFTAREVFSGWQGVLRRTRRHRRMLGWMQSGREGRLLGRVLLSWHGEASCGRLRHKQAASELRQGRQRSRLHTAFDALHAAVQVRRQKVQMSAAALRHLQRRLLRRCAAAWRCVVERCAAAQALLEKTSRRCQNLALLSVLRAWLEVVEARLQLRWEAIERMPSLSRELLGHMLGVCYRLAASDATASSPGAGPGGSVAADSTSGPGVPGADALLLGVCLRSWVRHASERRLCRLDAARAASRRLQHTLRAVLRCWQESAGQLVEQRSEARRLLDQAVRAGGPAAAGTAGTAAHASSLRMRASLHQHLARVRCQAMTRAFGEWRSDAQRTARLDRQGVAVARALRGRACARLLQAWRGAVQLAAAARLIVADFATARRRSQQREAMHRLSEACALARGRGERATQHADRASLRRTLALWVMLRQRSQDTALAAPELRARTLLSHALAAWLGAVASAAEEGSLREERLRAGLRFAGRRRCAAVLGAWLHRVRCRSRLQLLGHQLAAGVRLSRLSSLFSTWQDAAGTAAFNEQFCVVQQRRRSLQLAVLAFGGWHEAAQLVAVRRGACEAMGRALCSSLLRGMVGEWHWLAAQHQNAKLACAAIRTRMLRARHAQVFHSWLLSAQNTHAAVAQSVRCRERRRLRVAFMGWRTAAAGCRAVGRGCIPSHHNRPPAGGGSTGLATEHRRCVTLSSSLQGWISALQASKRIRQLGARLTARLARLCTGNVLHAWRAVVRRGTLAAVRMGRCRERAGRKLLGRALLHWADLAAERKAFLTSLRVCLKRQKIAFSLFKNWCVGVLTPGIADR
ncbi:MAG: hypothetical protein WDW36_010141 [Sanguina aurantia]